MEQGTPIHPTLRLHSYESTLTFINISQHLIHSLGSGGKIFVAIFRDDDIIFNADTADAPVAV